MQEAKSAIVTGASRGVGREVALGLAKGGTGIVLQARGAEALASLADEIRHAGGRTETLASDVADQSTAAAAVALAEASFGPVDRLVNNAGINMRTATLDMPLDDWQRVIDVNLTGTLHFCRAVLPNMIAMGGGAIVNVSSTMSKTPHPNAAPSYGASKAGVNYLTMHLAQEMATHNIRVNAACPGPIETEMTRQWDAAYRAAVTGKVPLGRLGMPDEVASLNLFLLSDAAGFVIGQTIDINGGTLMG